MGHKPVVTHLLERLAAVTNLNEVVVVVNDQHPSLWQQWQATIPPEPVVTVVSNGVVSEADRLGAVTDLATAVAAIDNADFIVVVAGDNLIDESLQAHVDAAIERNQPIVMCRDLGTEVPPGRFGEITIDDAGVVTRFREKPSHPESPLAATCTYVLPGAVANELAEYLVDGDADSPGSFIAWLAERTPVTARPLQGRYFDIGNHETLAAARSNW